MEKTSVGQQFVDLFKQSVITQALITFALILTCCILWIGYRPLPSDLLQMTVLVVGFWFGSKVGYSQGHSAASRTVTIPQAATATSVTTPEVASVPEPTMRADLEAPKVDQRG